MRDTADICFRERVRVFLNDLFWPLLFFVELDASTITVLGGMSNELTNNGSVTVFFRLPESSELPVERVARTVRAVLLVMVRLRRVEPSRGCGLSYSLVAVVPVVPVVVVVVIVVAVAVGPLASVSLSWSNLRNVGGSRAPRRGVARLSSSLLSTGGGRFWRSNVSLEACDITGMPGDESLLFNGTPESCNTCVAIGLGWCCLMR